MPDYTYSPAPVLVEVTGEFAIGATGVLRPSGSGTAVQVYDLNGSPLPNVTVGPKGAHQAFKADIPDGILDFGSVLLPAISQESLTAAMSVQQAAEQAAASAAQAAAVAVDKADLVDGVVPGAQLPAATQAAAGILELATAAEVAVGTDDGRAVTPFGLDGTLASYALQESLDTALASSVRVVAMTDKVVNNSTALSADADMVLDLLPGEWWQVDAHLLFTLALAGGTATDVLMQWSVPAGTTGWWGSPRAGWDQPGPAGTATGLLADINNPSAFALRDGTQGSSVRLIFKVGSTGGKLQLTWAQNTAAAADLTRLAGSNMACEKLTA